MLDRGVQPEVSPIAALPLDQQVVAIVADRGAGKTTLLSRWAHELSTSGQAGLTWLDAADVSVSVFEAAASVDEPTCIIIDDYHQVTDEGLTGWLLSNLGRTRHRLLVAGRPAPALQLHRWRASGLVTEFGTGDLRLGVQQLADLAASRQLDLEKPVLERILTLTDGWAGGVVSILDGFDVTSSDRARSVADPLEIVESAATQCGAELVGEIEAEIDADDYDFLLRTSVVDEMDRGLAAAMADHACGEECSIPIDFSGLIRRVPFTDPVDSAAQVIRIHPMVRLGLRQRLLDQAGAEAIVASHRAAAHHLQSAGRMQEAIDHFIAAGEPELAADALAVASTRDPSTLFDEDVDRITAAGAADYVPHVVTSALAHLRADRLGLAALCCNRLAEMEWDGPLPTGHPSLEEALTDLRGRLPQQTNEHMEGLIKSVDAAGFDASGPRDLASRYTAAHYCYWLGRLEEARERAGLILVGHRAIGRSRLIDQVVTVLASYLLALLERDQGQNREAQRHLERAELLLVDYGFGSLEEISKQAGDVERLVRAVVGDGDADDRLASLEGLVADAVDDWTRVAAAVEFVRLLDGLTRFDEAMAAFERLEDMVDGRDLPALLATRVARISDALRLDHEVVGPAMHITVGERAVLYLLADQSLSQAEIGDRLGLSINTIKSHLRSIYQKLGAAGRQEAIERAGAEGILATVQPWLHPPGDHSP